MIRFIVAAALLGLLTGCDAGPAADSPDGRTDSEISSDPKVIGQRMDKVIEEKLAKIKLPARAWLTEPNHSVLKTDKADVIKLNDDLLAAGVVGVWVSESETVEGGQVIDELFIELPTDSAKRIKIFEVFNGEAHTYLDKPEKDVGQKYLRLEWD